MMRMPSATRPRASSNRAARDLSLALCFFQFAFARIGAAVIIAELRTRGGKLALGVRDRGVLNAQLRAQRITLLAVAVQ